MYRKHTVPVASRDKAEREEREAKSRRKTKPALFQQDIASTGLLIAVVLVVLVAIAVPLRNYYEGRGEIARAQASIEALEARKKQLESDIARYEDPAYIEQEARRRLGVLAEGETAWRIIDPRMTQNPTITTDEIPDTRDWQHFLWDSLRELPEDEAEEPAVPAPADAPADASVEAPEPAEAPAGAPVDASDSSS